MPVYLIREGDTDRVKIGWADAPEVRRRQLQTSHHAALTILRTIEGPRRAETWMQDQFAAQCIRGEWFWFHPEMLAVEPPDFGPAPVKVAAKPRVSLVSWRADMCGVSNPCAQCLAWPA